MQLAMQGCRKGFARALLGSASSERYICSISGRNICNSKTNVAAVRTYAAVSVFTSSHSSSSSRSGSSSGSHAHIAKRFYTKGGSDGKNSGKGGDISNRNEGIKYPRMRVVWIDKDTKESKWEIMTRESALELAKKMSMDLILVNKVSDPPVCRVESYFKMKEEAKNKEKKKLLTAPRTMKEMYVGAGIEKHDLTTKMNKVIEMLEACHPVKIQITATKVILEKNPLAMEECTLKVLELAETHVSSVQQSRVKHGKKEFILNPKLKKD